MSFQSFWIKVTHKTTNKKVKINNKSLYRVRNDDYINFTHTVAWKSIIDDEIKFVIEYDVEEVYDKEETKFIGYKRTSDICHDYICDSESINKTNSLLKKHIIQAGFTIVPPAQAADY